MTFNVAVTVADEYEYLDRLLFMLKSIKYSMSFPVNIYIQADSNKVTSYVDVVVRRYDSVVEEYIKFPFEGDFAKFKNNLFSLCGEGYIYQIDADELPNNAQFMYLNSMLEKDPDIDLVHVPRINLVEGITQDDLNKWGWRVTEQQGMKMINFPDYQGRVYKNVDYLEWSGKVHERVVGAYKTERLAQVTELSLIHEKDINRQRNQNNLYDSL